MLSDALVLVRCCTLPIRKQIRGFVKALFSAADYTDYSDFLIRVIRAIRG